MKDLKVLVVAREYGKFIVGGAGVATSKLVEYLRNEGIEVYVLSFGSPEYSNELDHYIKPKSSILIESKQKTKTSHDIMLLFDIERITRKAKNLAKKLGIDIIHVQEPYIGGFISHKAKITTIHDTSYREILTLKTTGFHDFQSMKKMFFYSTLGFLMEYLSISSSHIIIAPSSIVKKELIEVYKTPKDKVYVIHNGVDIKYKFTYTKLDARKRLGLPLDKIVIFTASRHIPGKRLDLLIKAVYELVKKDWNLKRNLFVVIGGSGPITPQLERMVNNLGLNDVVSFTGWIDRDSIHLYYLASDIYVFPSSSESAPLSLLEACAYGLPIVTTRVGDYAMMMKDYRHALVIPPNNLNKLIEALLMAIKDEQIRLKLSINARKFAEQFSWKEIARKHIKLYQSLASKMMS